MASPVIPKLPIEIRLMIYAHYFGHRTVHVDLAISSSGIEDDGNEHKPFLGFAKCLSPVTSFEAFDASQQIQEGNPWGLRPIPDGTVGKYRFDNPHENCGTVTRINDASNVKNADSSLLMVSKSTYEEALPTLYKMTTFSFESARTLRTFVESLRPQVQRMVRSIHIAIEKDLPVSYPDPGFVSPALMAQRADVRRSMQAMTGLQNLHLSIIQDFLSDERPVNTVDFDCAPYRNHAEWLRSGEMPWWNEDLQNLVSPAVRNVTVLVSDTDEAATYDENHTIEQEEDYLEDTNRWTMAERAEFARALGDQLIKAGKSMKSPYEPPYKSPYT